MSSRSLVAGTYNMPVYLQVKKQHLLAALHVGICAPSVHIDPSQYLPQPYLHINLQSLRVTTSQCIYKSLTVRITYFPEQIVHIYQLLVSTRDPGYAHTSQAVVISHRPFHLYIYHTAVLYDTLTIQLLHLPLKMYILNINLNIKYIR